jgi:N-formylglutamate deformylase
MRDQRQEGVWHVLAPIENEAPLVLDSPHSGTEFPTEFRPIAPFSEVRPPEDSYIDDIFERAPSLGAALLRALFPRIYIDPNRSVRDLDPDQIDGEWTGPTEPGAKTKLGIGLIWTKTPQDSDLYGRKLTVREVRHRIDTYLLPYQGQLKTELDRVYEKFGGVWHINCHSMPEMSTERSPEGKAGVRRPDFVLGTQDGQTAGAEFTELARTTLAGYGYDVRINEYYKGVELIRAYSDPANNRHSMQIEINRCLYMNETTGWRNDNYETLKRDMGSLIEVLADYSGKQPR